MNVFSSRQNLSGRRGTIALVAAATALLALSFGVRGVLGMFLGPLNSATGVGFAAVSFALAVSQLVSGLAQPLCGAVSDRFGPARVVAAGAIVLACSIALLPLAQSTLALMAAFSLLAAALGAVGSTPTLLGAVNARVSQARAGLAAGIVSSGGALGQMALAPLTQWTIADFGWSAALYGLALVTLIALPLAWLLPHSAPAATQPASTGGDGMQALRAALADARYRWIALGFGVCGFHIAFLLAHMPGVIEGCGVGTQWTGVWLGVLGVANVTGSIGAGLALRRWSHLRVLAFVYAGRALGVIAFVLAPKSVGVLLAFAAWMGCTYMATVPPTSGLVARLYGVRNLGMLFGVIMLVHQVGSFLGIWLGGLAVERFGDYQLVWLLDIALALAATAIHLCLHEPAAAPDAVTPDPTRTRPASARADRSSPAAPAWRARRFAPASSLRSAAPSAAAGSG